MIENQRQYQATQEVIQKFTTALAEVQKDKAVNGESPRLDMYHSAIESQINSLSEELSEYERLNQPVSINQPASDFWTALEQFRESHDIVNADIDPDEIFANVRDRAPGREISLE